MGALGLLGGGGGVGGGDDGGGGFMQSSQQQQDGSVAGTAEAAVKSTSASLITVPRPSYPSSCLFPLPQRRAPSKLVVWHISRPG